MRRVTVGVEPPYDVVIGLGALGDAADVLAGRRRVAVVTQPVLAEEYGTGLGELLRAAGVEVEVFTMGEGEEAKSLATVHDLCRRLASWGLLRGDAVLALGGGVVGDVGGFVASVYHRGVDVVQAPTTLLAMVDAAVGGKTAVNLPEGKNLVGAFHQPRAVLADTATLATLPPAEYRAGLGEVAKYAGMPQGEAIGALLAAQLDAVLARDELVLAELVAGCVAIKAEVVASDPHERTGVRATLNYGHTLGHALETVGRYGFLHGEAVAVGIVFADAVAVSMERLGAAVAAERRELLSTLGLPVEVPPGAAAEELLGIMRRDKKASGGLTFVLPGPAGLELVEDPPSGALRAGFAAVGVRADVRD